MKKDNTRSMLELLLTPGLLILLGLILLLRPDTASVLISRVLGGMLVAAGIGFGISAIVTHRGQVGKGIAAVSFVLVGGWLARNPLFWAAWIGRILGALLVVDSLRDMMRAKSQGLRGRLPLIAAAVGVALVLLPMTASRLVFSLAGLVVLVVGVVMLLDRLRNRRRLEASSDPNIIDAL